MPDTEPRLPLRPPEPLNLPDFETGQWLKTTTSLCPDCLEPVTANVFERADAVWLDKRCPTHGNYSALLSSEARHYYRARQSSGGTCCGPSCGPASELAAPGANDAGWSNHSCTVLIEITERCNLSCPTCFAGSSPQHTKSMSLDVFSQRLDGLQSGGKQGADMIQLSGGEPTVHPHLFEMVDMLFLRGFRKVTINSNGIKLARPEFVKRLAQLRDRHEGAELFVYLQFDGYEAETYRQLRGRDDLLTTKQRALETCIAAGISVHPVMTLTRDLNDHEVGSFVTLATKQPAIKHVVIQPAMYSGRYENPRRVDRLTVADTVNLITEQFGVFTADDFGPIPCSDPNCHAIGVALRTDQGLIPISRYFPRYRTWFDEESTDLLTRFADTIDGPSAFSEALQWATAGERIETLLDDLDDAAVDHLLNLLAELQDEPKALWDRLLTISIKPFMDAMTYDQDRIDQCCVHILDDEGNPISFCEFNAVTRPRMEQARRGAA